MISTWTTAVLLVTTAIIGSVLVIRNRKILPCSTQQKKAVHEDMTVDSTRNTFDSMESSILDSPRDVRRLFHELLNLEDHPGIIPVALETLYQALDRAVAVALDERGDNDIMRVMKPEDLRKWIESRDGRNLHLFEEYAQRRKSGGPRELMPDLDSAKELLRAQAPLRYVDGAWLGRLSRVHIPWIYEQVVRQLWQILSEELGDGDPAKHHTNIYHALMRTFIPDMPQGHSAQFLEGKFSGRDHSVWQAGLVQLLIAMFPRDFLPEVLGFNLHFEGLTPEMMIATQEARELGLDSTYFMLHVSIDNAANGHSAMAVDAVCDYIQQIQRLDGPLGVAKAWRRVQAGYVLSEGRWNSAERDWARHAEREGAVADILGTKAAASCSIHSTSRTRLSGSKMRLAEWLEPGRMRSASWRRQLVRALGSSRHWVVAGDCKRSRFMRELLWGGRMFGAFDDTECRAVESWIEHLLPNPHHAYCDFTGCAKRRCPGDPHLANANANANANAGRLEFELELARAARPRRHALPPTFAELLTPMMLLTPVEMGIEMVSLSTDRAARWLPAVWYGHLSLLEQFIALPSRCGGSLAQTALRVLRAQNGLLQPTHSVSGINMGLQTLSKRSLSFSAVGSQLLAYHNLSSACSLTELLDSEPCTRQFVETMTRLSCCPTRRQSMLLGMATGFVPLHMAMASSCMFDADTKAFLGRVAAVEKQEFALCFDLIQGKVHECDDFLCGYHFIRDQLLELMHCQTVPGA